MNNYQSNTFTKELGWLQLDDEPKVQVRQQVKDQQVYASAIHDKNIPCKVIWQI